MSKRVMVPTDKCVPSNYRNEGDLTELQASINKRGIKSPLLLSTLPDDKYKIFAGHRRWRCAQNLGMPEVPAYFIDSEATPDDELLDQLVENNVHEKDGITLALKVKDLSDHGVKNRIIAEALGKTEQWASMLIGLVLKESVPYMAFITGHDLWYNVKGLNKFFMSPEDILAAGEKVEEYDFLEGTGKELASIFYCDELVKIYRKSLNPEIPEHSKIFNDHIAALVKAKRNTKADVDMICGKILRKLDHNSVAPTEKPVLDLQKAADSITKLFSKGKIEDHKALQKCLKNNFKKAGIPYRIYIEAVDPSKPDKEQDTP